MSDDGTKAFSQAALGRALGLSGAAVTKLKKLGMPVDSVEAAQAWREARQNVAQRKPLPDAAPASVRQPWPPFDDSRNPFSKPPRGPVMHNGRPVFGESLPDDLPPDGLEDRDGARTRREIAEANMAEIAEQKLRHEVILVAAIKRQMATDFATTRDALLQIPARMGPVLAAKGDAAEVQTILHEEIHKVLEDLAGAADGVERIEGAFD